MDAKRALEDADRLIAWADSNGQPEKPITFPGEMKKRVEKSLDSEGRYRGHPVTFLPLKLKPKVE